MEEPSLTTTSKRSQLFTWFSDWEEVCKSSSRPSLERPSPLTLSHLTLLRMSRLRSKTRKVSHLINKDSSLLESNWKMEELSLTITFKKNPLFTWSSDSEVECKFSLRPLLERPSPLMLSHQTPLKTSRPRSKIRKVSHPINKDSFSLESNWKTEEPFQTTTSKRNQPFTWYSDWEEVCKSSSRPSLVRPSH
jgi:hypothetical protein